MTTAQSDAIARVLALHSPVDEEVVVWAETDADHDDLYPDCEGNNDNGVRCNGHTRIIQRCDECGIGVDYENAPIYFLWPCMTVRALTGVATIGDVIVGSRGREKA